MSNIDAKVIKEIRDATGASILSIKNTLDELNGDKDKAMEVLKEKSLAKAEKREDRETGDGLVYAYIHNNGKVGSLIHMTCETDFVAKTDDFQDLCKELALQAATMEYDNVEEMLDDEYIRDSSKKISDLINEVKAKVGENMSLKQIARFKVGE